MAENCASLRWYSFCSHASSGRELLEVNAGIAEERHNQASEDDEPVAFHVFSVAGHLVRVHGLNIKCAPLGFSLRGLTPCLPITGAKTDE